MKTRFKKIIAGVISAVMVMSSFAVFAANDGVLPKDEVIQSADTAEPEITASPETPDMSVWDIPTTFGLDSEAAEPMALSADVMASGKCGDNLTWTLDSSGTLTISGTGDMYNYITGGSPWLKYKDNLKKLSILDGVTSIGDWAFYYCPGFSGNLIIPDSVTRIGWNAFAYCRGFSGNLIIPDSVTSIGDYAFIDCSGFTGDLIIPDGVTSIGDYAFMECLGFTGNLIIPDSVTSIGDHAFIYCSGFTGDLIIPDGVTSIGNNAFDGCGGFTGDLVIPDSVTSIGNNAFRNCVFTGDLIIPEGVTSIGSFAFFQCTHIKNMYILQNEDSIGTGDFPNRVHWKYDLSKCTATIKDYTCTGEAIIPTEDSITVTSPNGKTLYYGTDYVITGANNNTSVGTATAHIAPPEGGISIMSQDVPFNIVGIDISGAAVTFPNDITWDGAAVEPEPTVILDGKTLVKGTDYTITYSNNVFTAGDFPTKDTTHTATATITGIGNYIGSLSKDFEVKGFDPKNGVDSVDIRLDDIISATIDGTFVYNGKEHTPTPRLVYHFINPTTNVLIDYEMVEGKDFEVVSYLNNVNAGKAVVTIEGIGAFENTRRITFNISACELSAATIADIPSAEYCKKDICPNPEIKIGDKVMQKDVDYELSYENNRNAGTATVTITGKGNLSGTVTKNFEITPRDGTKFTIVIWL